VTALSAERVPRRLAVVTLAVLGLVFVLLAGRWLLHTRAPYAGTNSVAPKYNLAGPTRGHSLCVKGLTLPGSANGIRFRVAAAGAAPLRVTLRLDAGGSRLVSTGSVPGGGGLGLLDFAFPPRGKDVPATACLTTSGTVVAMSGQPSPGTGTGSAFIGGKQVGVPSIWFLRSPSRRLVSALPDGARHASLFRAGFVGSWTYLVLALLIVLCWIAGLWLLLRQRA
jgi:hypothetical protein